MGYLVAEKIAQIFKSRTILEAGKIFKIQNFEFNVSSHESESLDQKDSDKHYVEELASVCPHLRIVKLNINKESDEFVKHLEMMPGIQELIIDFPGSLGLGFNSFLVASGTGLSQLGLSLGEYTAQHMKL